MDLDGEMLDDRAVRLDLSKNKRGGRGGGGRGGRDGNRAFGGVRKGGLSRPRGGGFGGRRGGSRGFGNCRV